MAKGGDTMTGALTIQGVATGTDAFTIKDTGGTNTLVSVKGDGTMTFRGLSGGVQALTFSDAGGVGLAWFNGAGLLRWKAVASTSLAFATTDASSNVLGGMYGDGRIAINGLTAGANAIAVKNLTGSQSYFLVNGNGDTFIQGGQLFIKDVTGANTLFSVNTSGNIVAGPSVQINGTAAGADPQLQFWRKPGSSPAEAGLIWCTEGTGRLNLRARNGANAPSIDSSGNFYVWAISCTTINTNGSAISNSGTITPATDNAQNIGSDTLRFNSIYAGQYFVHSSTTPIVQFKTGSTVGFRMFWNVSPNQFQIDNLTAGVYLQSGSSTWSTASDIALKKNIADYHALDRLADFRCVTYDLKADDSRRHVGAIAQECMKAFPEVVDDSMGIRYAELAPIALQACKELLVRVEALEKRS